MRAPRRLPTSLLVLLATALLAAGSLWWLKTAPRTTARPGPTSDMILIELEDGTILTQSATTDPEPDDAQFRNLQKIITTDWPCRPAESDSRLLNMMDNQSLEYVPRDGAHVIRLPRCSARSRSGR